MSAPHHMPRCSSLCRARCTTPCLPCVELYEVYVVMPPGKGGMKEDGRNKSCGCSRRLADFCTEPTSRPSLPG
jgi:hypothetical protein